MKTNQPDEPTLSTGQAARFLGVTTRALLYSIERHGKIAALPRLHDRAHHRILVSEIVEYMTRNNMPVPAELANA